MVDQLLTELQLDEQLSSSPAPRVTKEYIESRINDVAYYFIDQTVTVCSIRIDNGFSVRGESACVNPANFDIEIGKTIAYKNAFDKLWSLFGFLLAEEQFKCTQ